MDDKLKEYITEKDLYMHVAICDDDQFYISKIHESIKPYKITYIDLSIVEFEKGEDVIAYCKSGNTIDIIFLDIQMTGINGIETAHGLKSIQEDIIVIFISSYTRFITDAFRLRAFQYLLKPVRNEQVQKEFELAVEQYNIAHQKYVFKWKYTTYSLEIKDIYFIESQCHNLIISTKKEKLLKIGSLKEEQLRLSVYNFIRCHNGFIVNMKYIYRMEKYVIILINNEKIPISKRMKKKVYESFTNYVARSCL